MEKFLIRLGQQCKYEVSDSSGVAAVRRAGAVLSQQLGFNELRAGELAIVITEAATNIVKHASHGQILLRSLEHGKNVGIEIIAIDSGPGIANVPLLMEDGNSTAGSYGVGLGAIERMTDEFSIFSTPDRGAVLLMIVWADKPATTEHEAVSTRWQIGAVCIPVEGEETCGDAWIAEGNDNSLTLLVADGLGHGPDAAKASLAAVTVVIKDFDLSPTQILQRAHAELHSTRGAAVAVAAINETQICFAGIGNIAVSMYESGNHFDSPGSKRQHFISHNGIVGHNMRKVQEFANPWHASNVLIAHSDGIGTRWDLDQYPGLATAHAGIIAAVLYRDFARVRDDATVVVIQELAET